MKLRKIKIPKMNKRAELLDIVIWSVSAFIVVVILAFWIYVFAQLTDALTAIPAVEGQVNISAIAVEVFVPLNDAMANFKWISFAIMFSLGISIIIFNYFTHKNAAYFWLYILLVIAAVVISVPIANEYESLLTDPVIGTTLTSMKASSWVVLFLPLWTAVIGIFGAIALFIGMQRDRGTRDGFL